MTPGRVCDLFYWWASQNRTEEEWYKVKSRLEIPPLGYTGSLKGTGWDPDEMIKDYQQGGGDVTR